MTSFDQHIADYLQLRRSLGYQLKLHGQVLPKFARHLDELGAEFVTTEIALGWTTEGEVPDGSVAPAMRMLIVRGFARYLSGIDPRTEIPPTALIPLRQTRRPAFIYTEEQILLLMATARTRIRQAVCRAAYETVIGLLAATGLRISEAVKLDRDDVDLTHGVLVVRESKFNKSRYVPLHPTTLEALVRYARERDRLCPDPKGPSFFVSLRRDRLGVHPVQAAFRRLCVASGVGAGAPFPPRLHDLRHTMAVRTLLGWYRDGQNVQAKLPALSTYLGHRSPKDTYYYLSAAPELLACAAGLLEHESEVVA